MNAPRMQEMASQNSKLSECEVGGGGGGGGWGPSSQLKILQPPPPPDYFKPSYAYGREFHISTLKEKNSQN